MTGKKGRNGRDGKDGRNGLDGKDGRNGKDLVRNWKECAWNKITDGKNLGLIKVKNQIYPALHVAKNQSPKYRTFAEYLL